MEVKIINKKMLCWDNDESSASECNVIAEALGTKIEHRYLALMHNEMFASFKNAKPLPTEKQRTIDDGLEVGDVIINKNYKHKILGTCGNVVFISYENDFSKFRFTATLESLIYDGYKLETETIEMTVAEVSKLVGKNVKIVKE